MRHVKKILEQSFPHEKFSQELTPLWFLCYRWDLSEYFRRAREHLLRSRFSHRWSSYSNSGCNNFFLCCRNLWSCDDLCSGHSLCCGGRGHHRLLSSCFNLTTVPEETFRTTIEEQSHKIDAIYKIFLYQFKPLIRQNT